MSTLFYPEGTIKDHRNLYTEALILSPLYLWAIRTLTTTNSDFVLSWMCNTTIQVRVAISGVGNVQSAKASACGTRKIIINIGWFFFSAILRNNNLTYTLRGSFNLFGYNCRTSFCVFLLTIVHTVHEPLFLN